MHRIATYIDQLPGTLFVLGTIVLLGAVRAFGTLARVAENPGGVELAAVLMGALGIVALVFAVRRRQSSVLVAAAQLLAALAGANALGLALLWPFLPPGSPVSLLDLVIEGVAGSTAASVVGVPVAVASLWLSRRYGSNSLVTERRARVVYGTGNAAGPVPATSAATNDGARGPGPAERIG
ncbi:MAG: hypothetical protein ACYC3Q_14795 [Gemmatimonadaceae bacterium]